jgi:hypothetical protein
MHYGLSYKAGAVTCTGSLGSQICSVPVSFQPTYPGGRRDALFLTNGTTRLATVLAYGIGKSPFALIQPGVLSTSVPESADYLYGSAVDENGVLYILASGANRVYAQTTAGVVTALTITGLVSPRAIGVDGAGVLYIADQKPHGPTTTYDIVHATQSSIRFPSGPVSIQAVTVGNTGTLYQTDSANLYVSSGRCHDRDDDRSNRYAGRHPDRRQC